MQSTFDHDPFQMLTRSLHKDGEHLFIDAGANRGDITHRIRTIFPNATIAAFEPLPDTFELLTQRFKHDHRVITINAALSDIDGSATLHATTNDRFSSLLPPTPDLQADTHGSTHVANTITIKTTRLDTWLAESGFPGIDVIKADVQGAELAVLRGAGGSLANTHAVFAEAQIAPSYTGAATFADIDLFLRQADFHCHQIHTVVTRGRDQHTESIDALWLSPEALRKTRETPLQALMPRPARRLVSLLNRCKDAGHTSVALMPAGTHTASLAPWFTAAEGVSIAAAIDDNPAKAGSTHAGLPVLTRDQLPSASPPISAVIICSDSYESEIYDTTNDLRSNIPVLRLHADTE